MQVNKIDKKKSTNLESVRNHSTVCLLWTVLYGPFIEGDSTCITLNSETDIHCHKSTFALTS